jgi:hypothetical protein
METPPHLKILRTTGSVLLTVGLIDTAVMIYHLVRFESYSSSFNILAVITGILLLQGSLRTVSFMRWYALLLIPIFIALLFIWPFMQPLDLTLTQYRLNPGWYILTWGVEVFELLFLYWVYRQLSNPLVQAARAAAGRKVRNMYIPAVLGVVSSIFSVVFAVYFLGGAAALKAKSLAEQKLGSSFRYHVSSLNISTNNQGTFAAGLVIAWNDKEIRYLPVSWKEQ